MLNDDQKHWASSMLGLRQESAAQGTPFMSMVQIWREGRRVASCLVNLDEEDKRAFIVTAARAFFADRVDVAMDVWAAQPDQIDPNLSLEHQLDHALVLYSATRDEGVTTMLATYTIEDDGSVEYREIKSGSGHESDPYAQLLLVGVADSNMQHIVMEGAEAFGIDEEEAVARYHSVVLQYLLPQFPEVVVQLDFQTRREQEIAESSLEESGLASHTPPPAGTSWN